MVPQRLAASVALIVCATATSPTFAQQPPAPSQPPASPTGDAALVEARRLYDEGTAHFAANRFAEALAAYQRAYLLRSNPVVLVPIIECQERLDRVVDAISSIERYLRDRPTAPDRARMEQRLQALRVRPSRVNVLSPTSGARVVLDGRELPQSTPAELHIPPGRHRIALSINGQRGEEREIDALPGGSQEVSFATAQAASADPPATTPTETTPTETTPPAPVTTPPPAAEASTVPPVQPPVAETPRRRGPSPAVWVAASAGGVGLVMGTVFGLMALSDASAYEQTPTRELYDRGRTNALVSDIGFGVAILSAAVGVIVYFADRGGSSERPRAALRAPTPRWSASPGGLMVNF